MQSLFDDFLCALKILFALQNYGYIFIMFAELWCTDICGIMGPNF